MICGVLSATVGVPTGDVICELRPKRLEMPAVIGFTVETDGSLPDGTKLGAAIERVDTLTDSYPTHYMINCAHPTHFSHLFRLVGSSLRGSLNFGSHTFPISLGLLPFATTDFQ